MVRFLISHCFQLLSSTLLALNNSFYCVLKYWKASRSVWKKVPQIQVPRKNTKGRNLLLRNHEFLLVCFKMIWKKIWCDWCINILVIVNWFMDGYLMDWRHRKWKSLFEKGIYKLELSVEYVVFDHRSRWRNFCDFL